MTQACVVRSLIKSALEAFDGVVVFLAQPFEPDRLIRPGQLRLGGLRKLDEARQVPVARILELATVRETLEFAFQCKGLLHERVMKLSNNVAFSREFQNKRVEIIMLLLGLTRVADSRVGNDVVKGTGAVFEAKLMLPLLPRRAVALGSGVRRTP